MLAVFQPERVHFVDTALLRVEVHEWGPSQGRPVVLLHGWPDSARTWSDLAPALAAQGRRVIVPSLRGYAGTRFLDSNTPRSGQLSALAQDTIDLADALGIARFDVVGHDWGARAAYISSALWPNRVERCVTMAVGWGTNQPDQPLSYVQAHNYWYHWLMHTPRGADAVRNDRVGITRYLWKVWAPSWTIDEDEFMATAQAFNNPDWADVVLHSYTHRWGSAPSDPRYDALEQRLKNPPVIRVPTMLLHGDEDGANGLPTSEGRESLFSGGYERIVLKRCGHFPQREFPAEVNAAVLRFLGS